MEVFFLTDIEKQWFENIKLRYRRVSTLRLQECTSELHENASEENILIVLIFSKKKTIIRQSLQPETYDKGIPLELQPEKIIHT